MFINSVKTAARRHGSFAPTVLLAVLLGACAAPEAPVEHVQIANNVSMPLLLPKQAATVTHKMRASYTRDKYALTLQVQSTPQQIAIAGLAPTDGARQFNLTFDGSKVAIWKSPSFHARFDGAYLLADYELTEFDTQRLRNALPKYVTLEETQEGDLRKRSLKNGIGRTVIEIRYEKNLAKFCNIEREYCLEIENPE